jgi:hypothetical protein
MRSLILAATLVLSATPSHALQRALECAASPFEPPMLIDGAYLVAELRAETAVRLLADEQELGDGRTRWRVVSPDGEDKTLEITRIDGLIRFTIADVAGVCRELEFTKPRIFRRFTDDPALRERAMKEGWTGPQETRPP